MGSNPSWCRILFQKKKSIFDSKGVVSVIAVSGRAQNALARPILEGRGVGMVFWKPTVVSVANTC